MSKLSSKQAAFVREYLKDGNATAAARRAGYSDPNYGRQLMAKPNVAAYLAKLNKKAESSAVMSKQEVLERWTSMARGEGTIPRSTPTGIHELPPDWSDRHRALQDLAKYHNLSVEKRVISFEKHPDDMTAAEVLEALSALSE